MIIFDQLRISDDGKQLYINAHVNRASYFANVVITEVTVMTADYILETDPCTPTRDYIYKKTFAGEKEIDLVLDRGVLDYAFAGTNTNEASATVSFDKTTFSHDLIFVYIKAYGVTDECVPCSLQKEYTVGVTFDESLLYQKVLGYVKAMQQDCNVPVGFVDYILWWNLFKAAVETEHFVDAINIWKRLFGLNVTEQNNSHLVTGYKNPICGCHG